MNVSYLGQLTALVESLLKTDEMKAAIADLKERVQSAADAFKWTVIDDRFFKTPLPGKLKSGWIFILKQGVSSGCHYHPNSVQHMIVVEGRGRSKIADKTHRMLPLGTPNSSPQDNWFIIDQGVEHEFLPQNQDMVVISFHTCTADELIEVSCGDRESRSYT